MQIPLSLLVDMCVRENVSKSLKSMDQILTFQNKIRISAQYLATKFSKLNKADFKIVKISPFIIINS